MWRRQPPTYFWPSGTAQGGYTAARRRPIWPPPARNSARNKLRQLTPTVPLPEDLVLVDPHTPQGLLEQREQAAAVQRALLAMEDTDREIFLRYYYYYQKISQIAAAMT